MTSAISDGDRFLLDTTINRGLEIDLKKISDTCTDVA
jgi:hypothetical protein